MARLGAPLHLRVSCVGTLQAPAETVARVDSNLAAISSRLSGLNTKMGARKKSLGGVAGVPTQELASAFQKVQRMGRCSSCPHFQFLVFGDMERDYSACLSFVCMPSCALRVCFP
jgi:hypothetical protein